MKIRDTIVYECQRLAGRLLRGLDDESEIDITLFNPVADPPKNGSHHTTMNETDTDTEESLDADLGDL